MSAIGRHAPPAPLLSFCVAIGEERVAVPEEVRKALQLLLDTFLPTTKADAKRKPRDLLNRRVAQARRQNRRLFQKLWRWTRSPQVREACRRVGQLSAWRACRRAFLKIHRGAKAHVAFGMSSGGAPASFRFTKYESAAFRTEYYIQQGYGVEEAMAKACDIEGLSYTAWREVRRHRHERPLVWLTVFPHYPLWSFGHTLLNS